MKVKQFDLAKAWIQKKKELAKTKAEFEELDSKLKDFMYKNGMKTIEVDGEVIELTVASRRTFDAAVLKTLIKPALFSKVTKPTVDNQLIDAAVKMGDLSEGVLEQAKKETEYKQLNLK